MNNILSYIQNIQPSTIKAVSEMFKALEFGVFGENRSLTL